MVSRLIYFMHSVFLSLYVQVLGLWVKRWVVPAEYRVEFVDALVWPVVLRSLVLGARRHGDRLWERRVLLRWHLSVFGCRFKLVWKYVDCFKDWWRLKTDDFASCFALLWKGAVWLCFKFRAVCLLIWRLGTLQLFPKSTDTVYWVFSFRHHFEIQSVVVVTCLCRQIIPMF